MLKVLDPRLVKMFYKGKSLRNDGLACKDEGLKTNSDILCIVARRDIFPY